VTRAVVTASLLAAIGCGQADAPAPAAAIAVPAPPVADVAPRLVPAPGIDLAGPVPSPVRGVGTARPARPALDLVADRAVVRIDAPEPPRGGAVAFEADDHPAWIARIPESLQLPAVAYGDGRVYVSGGFQSTAFYALDASSGEIRWMTQNLEDNGPTAAVFDGGRVVFNTESCTLFALDAATGKRLWLRRLGDPTLAQTAVAGPLVFASHPEETGGYALSAYRVADGEPVWSQPVAGELLAAPVVAGDSVYATTTTGITYRVLRGSGRLVWSREFDATTAPWIAGNELYVTRQVHNQEQQIVVAIDTAKVVREQALVDGKYVWDVPGDTNDPQAVWAFEGSRPVIDHGVRYVAMGGAIRASDAQTGAPLWERRYAGKLDSRSVGSVALAGSAIVVATRDGQLFGLDIDTGYTLWSYDLGHTVVAEPVVARGWVYAATTDGFVIALHVADDTFDGWHMFGGNAGHDGAA